MRWRNNAAGFGAVTIAFHWAAAASVVAMLFTAAAAWASPDEQSATEWMMIHGAIGVLVWLLLAARIVWHFVERRPTPVRDEPRLNRVAGVVHVMLLILIAMQLLTGPIDIWTGGWPISIGNWFALPSPLGTALNSWHDRIGTIHSYTGYAIGLILGLHVAGALKHLLIDRDRTFHRMLGLRGPRQVVRPADDGMSLGAGDRSRG